MKLNKTIYNKLLLQAEEAREQGMEKLAHSILNSIGSYPEEGPSSYSYLDLKEEIHNDLWKIATKMASYYDLDSTDAIAINTAIESIASNMIEDLENTLGVQDKVTGPKEPLLPGEDK